ncbi:MAG: hypothetical protein WA941_13030 [Nitrososphaeraceae archaeon]
MPKKGYRQIAEHRRRIIEGRPKDMTERLLKGRLRWYETHRAWNLGKPHSQLTKRRISEAMKHFWANEGCPKKVTFN